MLDQNCNEVSSDTDPLDPYKAIGIHFTHYQRLMTAAKSMENRLRAQCLSVRSIKGEELDDAKKHLKGDLAKLAADVRKVRGTTIKPDTPRVMSEADMMLGAMQAGIDPVLFFIELHRYSIEKYKDTTGTAIETAVKALPIAKWVLDIKGAGLKSTGLLIGALGGPMYPKYACPARVWKRMGLSVLSDGTAQRKIAGDKELAIEAGFSPQRRSIMHNIGESLVKGNQTGSKAKDNVERLTYSKMYFERKQYEVEMSPKLPAWHVNKRAMRYMEKQYLKNMFNEWKRLYNGGEC